VLFSTQLEKIILKPSIWLNRNLLFDLKYI